MPTKVKHFLQVWVWGHLKYMKTVNAQHSSNVIGAITNLIESKGSDFVSQIFSQFTQIFSRVKCCFGQIYHSKIEVLQITQLLVLVTFELAHEKIEKNLYHKIRSTGFPKTLPQEEVKSNIFENEFATSMIEQYFVVRAKQLLVPMLIYHFWRHWRQIQWIFLKVNNHQDLLLLAPDRSPKTTR